MLETYLEVALGNFWVWLCSRFIIITGLLVLKLSTTDHSALAPQKAPSSTSILIRHYLELPAGNGVSKALLLGSHKSRA